MSDLTVSLTQGVSVILRSPAKLDAAGWESYTRRGSGRSNVALRLGVGPCAIATLANRRLVAA